MPGTKAAGQSFKDTWSWNDAKEEWLDAIQDDWPAVYQAIESAKLCHSDGMGGYIAFMTVRLVELHRVLKPTGSMYLHCDPSANSYLRVACDAIFGKGNFRNEIVWCYPPGGRGPKYGYHRKHDTIFYYGKSPKHGYFDRPYRPLTESAIKKFTETDGDRRYKSYPGGRTYLDQMKGTPVADWWTDIHSLGQTQSKERTGLSLIHI